MGVFSVSTRLLISSSALTRPLNWNQLKVSDLLRFNNSTRTLARMASGQSGESGYRNVYVTRNIPNPGLDILNSAGMSVNQWKHDDVVPREELLHNVPGSHALFCLLTDKVDAKLLDAAGIIKCEL